MSTDTAKADQADQAETPAKPANEYEDRGAGSLAGNLTRDPELRFTPGGRPVASLRVAETPRVLNRRTQRWEDGETVFHDVTLWSDQAENAAECLQKGDRVVAVGRWQSRTYTDRDGAVQERIALRADDLGPSLKFRMATPARRITRTRGQVPDAGPGIPPPDDPPPF